MNHIHWYPGHIAKAQKQLKEKLNLVDVIIEVIDARIPYSSMHKTTSELCLNKPRLILMNKSDVSDKNYNEIWAKIISEKNNSKVIITSLSNKKDISNIISNVAALSKEVMQKRLQKGLLIRPTRTMVIGMPNVGKSSTINRLVGKSKTKFPSEPQNRNRKLKSRNGLENSNPKLTIPRTSQKIQKENCARVLTMALACAIIYATNIKEESTWEN